MRLASLDILRGIFVLLMIIFHFLWDLNEVGIIENFPDWFWEQAPNFIGGSFLLIAGYSSAIEEKNTPREVLFKKFIRKFGRIAAVAFFVSIVSTLLFPEVPIYFGILHCIAGAYVFIYIISKFTLSIPTFLSILGILIGAYYSYHPVEEKRLFWLLSSDVSDMSDYYPLLPWACVACLGYLYGKKFYIQQSHKTPELASSILVKFFLKMGRHSLVIYLLHQPILLSIIKFSVNR